MSHPSVVTLRMPPSLKDHVAAEAKEQGISLNQYIVMSLTEKISAEQTAKFFERRLAGKSREQILADFDKVMAKLDARPAPPPDEIPEWDRWPEGMEMPEL